MYFIRQHAFMIRVLLLVLCTLTILSAVPFVFRPIRALRFFCTDIITFGFFFSKGETQN